MTDERFPLVQPQDLPWLTFAQMRQADELAMGRFGIDLLQMMEHAGRAMAELVMRLAPNGNIVVLAGSGNNGGGGLCAARHLVNRGREVAVVLAKEKNAESVVHHARTLARMGILPSAEPPDAPVVVDALVGYGLHGPLEGRTAELADWAAGRTVFSLDVPSGIGFAGAVEPAATLALALPKTGLEDTRPLFVADLGLPSALWAEMGLEVGSVFRLSPIVKIRDEG